MRGLIIIAMLVSSLTALAAANHVGNGGNAGNGGDPIALDFLQNGNKIVADVSSEIYKYPELTTINLLQTLQKITVVVTNDDLWVTIDGRRQLSTAMNYPATMTVVINRALWRAIPNRDQKLSLTFHELLGLVGLEKSGDYSISKRYENKFENSELLITRLPLGLVPAKTTSCFNQKMTPPGQEMIPDIEDAHFRIPKLYFFRSDSTKDLIIAGITISYALPTDDGQSTEINQCVYAGDQLRALSRIWWNQTEAKIPARKGTFDDMFTTDCSLLCGGIRTREKGFTTSADVTVYGLERDANGDETPVRMNRSIKIQNF